MRKYPDAFYEQSAVIPYRMGPAGVEVLLITAIKSGKWIVPKGVVEPASSAPASAAAEAYEEAGVSGTVGERLLGTYQYDKWGGTCTVEVFALAVETELDDWPEKEFRRREWLRPEEAAGRIAVPGLADIIRAFEAP